MAKKNTKSAAKKKAPAKAKLGSSTGSGDARSAARGGTVAVERYAKDPKSVVMRLKEKVISIEKQAANAILRADNQGLDNPHVTKLRKLLDAISTTKKVFA
jgi:hypothetical protein